MNLPTGTQGRLLALAILLIPMALLFRFGILPLWEAYQSGGSGIAEAREQLERYQRLGAQVNMWREYEQRLRDAGQLAPYLIDAPNAALAAASVQQRLKEVAGAHDGRILSTRVIKNSDQDGPFERITVGARLQLTLEGLQSLVHELETGQPYLFFDNVSVMSRPARRGRRHRAKRVQSNLLETRLTLYGLRRSQAQGAAGG